MTKLFKGSWILSAVLLTSVAILPGCGKFVGVEYKDLSSGAHYTPVVVYKASTAATAASEATSSEATSTEATSAGGTGTLRGRVELTENMAPLPLLFGKGAEVKDAAVCAAVDVPNETIVTKDGALANVFIYLRKPPKVSGGAAGEASIMFDQKNCVFKPHAMIMRVGQTVKVLNSDGVAHNTHTNAQKNPQFNQIVSPNEAVGIPLIYKKSEQDPISVVCDIHPWMRGYHLPVDHPFAALSAEDGTFEIKDLPAGKHEFKVWHEAGGLIEKALVVTIKPGDNDPLTIKVSPAQLKK